MLIEWYNIKRETIIIIIIIINTSFENIERNSKFFQKCF